MEVPSKPSWHSEEPSFRQKYPGWKVQRRRSLSQGLHRLPESGELLENRGLTGWLLGNESFSHHVLPSVQYRGLTALHCGQ